ncbi:hypothetical protein Ptr902_06835 [Pyrenophora tritici-repentis]|nr:hypothetical protein L13192_02682 [Pyrenophora tritici-repentis]KAI2482454.1 hypothetical protein Ptr902_06835 [Pyrenophora tritici-repentis]
MEGREERQDNTRDMRNTLASQTATGALALPVDWTRLLLLKSSTRVRREMTCATHLLLLVQRLSAVTQPPTSRELGAHQSHKNNATSHAGNMDRPQARSAAAIIQRGELLSNGIDHLFTTGFNFLLTMNEQYWNTPSINQLIVETAHNMLKTEELPTYHGIRTLILIGTIGDFNGADLFYEAAREYCQTAKNDHDVAADVEADKVFDDDRT